MAETTTVPRTATARTDVITRRLAQRHAAGRIVSCLEGGYNVSALARSVEAHIRVLADGAGR